MANEAEIIASNILSFAIEYKRLYDTTKNNEYKVKEQRLRRIAENIRLLLTTIGGSDTLDSVTDQGATTTNAINVGGITSDYFQFDTAATPTLTPGMFAWNDAYGTADLRLKGNNVTLQLGQELLARVVNKTGANLLESDYKVVRVRIASEGGAQGQRLAVVLAQGDNDPDSATTLGIVTENIANNQEGFITIVGNVNNINTTGSLQGETWVDGDVLYLSPTTPGSLTKVKPVAPQHTLIVGYVVYAHNNQGKIFVKVDNGYELDELHNVLITSPANNDLLQYNSAQQIWKNIPVGTAVPTPTLAQVTTAGNTTTNAITVGGLTVATNLIYTDTVNGRVGIGTTSPTDKFHIVDNTNGNKFARISAGGTDASAAWVAQNDQLDNVVYRVFGSAVTGTQMGISLARSASLLANLGGSGKFLLGTFSSTDFVMGTGNQERMRLVNATGNFLIGTTADNGNKLQVSGSIDSTGYYINNIVGYTGTLNIPGNPPGTQNVDIQGGIIVNIF